MTSSNAQKYEDVNPVVGKLLDRFFGKLGTLAAPLAPAATLDAGCGEGLALSRLRPHLPGSITGFDLSETAVGHARAAHPDGSFSVEDITAMPYEDDAFDLVMCFEVLEHLDDPEAALREIKRVGRGHVLLSVPHEPWFQLGNAARGKYRSTYGNHPEHVQHWGPRSFVRFLQPHFDAIELHRSFPWLMVRARIQGS